MKRAVAISIFLLTMLGAGLAFAQTSAHETTRTGATPVPPPAQAEPHTPVQANQPGTHDTPAPGFGNTLAQAVVNDTVAPDDHVPCFFTLKQLMKLRPLPSVARLTAADQSQVLTSLVQAINDAKETDLNIGAKREFMEKLAGDLDGKLIGKTPGEALATIMRDLYEIQANNSEILKAAHNPDAIKQLVVNKATAYGGEEYGSSVGKHLSETTESWYKRESPTATVDAIENLLQSAPEAGFSTKNKTAADETAKDLASAGSVASVGAVASSARDAINKLAPPDDIGCAYQILGWNESRLLFGRSVANNFIAVQVTVRNLNAKEEFIVHNAMLSVDTDINGAIGQYQEGEDKIGVEAYNNAGESLTPRGVVGNGITAAGALLSTLQPIVNAANFSNAVAAFTGGVVPGWKTMSPDHQKDQLLLIANSGFSATYTTKTVVGKSGAATFYTWFPAKPFLEGWWVQDCAQNMAKAVDLADTNTSSGKSGSGATGGQNNPEQPVPELGVDKKRARSLCNVVRDEPWKIVSYQKWSPISDQLFRDLSLAVVAGIHVREDSKNKASFTEMKCPTNQSGELDLTNTSSDGSLSCDLSGDNLDKAAKLRLENAADSVDPVRPEATVTVSGDNTSAKAAFKVSDLASAPGTDYNVYAVGKDGAESSTGLPAVHLDTKDVTLFGIDPVKINLNNLPSKVTLTGINLNNLSKVCFLKDSATQLTVDVKKGSSKTQTNLDPTSLRVLTAADWEIYANECSDLSDSKLKLIVTGAIAPKIGSFSPTSAIPGQTITINGSNFTGATSVTIGGVETKQLQHVEDSKITATVPDGAVSGSITVITPGGSDTHDGFKVIHKAAGAVAKSGKTGGHNGTRQ